MNAEILQMIGEFVREALDEATAPLLKRLEELETRGIKYCGVWQRAMRYERGAVVTHKGSAWIVAAPETEEQPGDHADWCLMVKAGRDA